ncbi:hypothetical protein FO488_00115 [Geobacter sp. FeAm09]|uniref:hypothetical protein n=1 Tax=Geobacter sp. FeAm09 TaxID=2597769 RepID=UPI0011EF2962|nr:hypothetical protein [Geobacter sp. FeAm09]QEM66712.1 hypothetical protein FO488_00115 [Geobacter sp. FeAm09]
MNQYQQYNALKDALAFRVIRSKVDNLLGYMPPAKLLILLLHLINPGYVRPILIGIRDNISGMSDEALDKLIDELLD